MAEPLLFFNLGLGQESTATAILHVCGELPAPYYEIPRERVFSVFSDTGAGLKPTYQWKRQCFEPWLLQHGFRLHTLHPGGVYHQCDPSPSYPAGRVMHNIVYEHRKDKLPSFPTRSSARCTTNAKGRPLGKFRSGQSLLLDGIDNRQRAAQVVRGIGEPNIVAIGYSAGEVERAQSSDANHTAKHWKPVYPLIEMGLNRAACRKVIERAGLPVPMKSGCIMCPWAPTWHFYWLREKYPTDFRRAQAMENAAVAQKLARGERPCFIKDDMPLNDAVEAWHRKHPLITADQIERWMYERDVYAVGRRCSLEIEGTFCNPLELDLSGITILHPQARVGGLR